MDASSDKTPTLRKLTLWSKCNLFLLNLFCASIYSICKPLGLERAVGTMFISSMFGAMMFIPTIVCWLILKGIDMCYPGSYEAVMDTKHIWGTAILVWHITTILTDRAPKTVIGANHRPPRNYVDWASHQLYFYSIIDFFPITITPWAEDAELPTSRQYVFGIHPHGVFCWSLFMFAAKGTPFDKRFPGLCGEKLSGLIASVLFMIPVLRDFFLQWPYLDASRKVASSALAAGRSLYLIPGGEEENVLTTRGEDTVVLSKRKGFIRLALSYGADLVPVFGAGTTDTFVTYPKVFGFRKTIQKKLGVAVEVYRGRFFTPLPFTDTPQRILIGKPIPTPKPKVNGEKPDEALVEEYHKKYIAALKELHAQHVKDRPLRIV